MIKNYFLKLDIFIFKILRFFFKSKKLDSFISKQLSTKNYSTLEISTTIGCAMMCSYCPQELHKANGKLFEKRMQIETLKEAAKNIEKNVTIHWTGYSEALGNKNFPEFSEIIKKNGNKQLLNTTLHGHSNCVEFLKKTNNFFQILLHLPDNKNYMKLKVDQDYLSNLEEVVKFQSKRLKNKLFVLVFGDDFEPQVKKVIEKLLVEGFLKKENVDLRKHLHTRAGDNLKKKDLKEDFYTNSLANNKKDNQLFYCSNRRLNQGVLIPDGRVSLCCHDYSLKYFKGDLKNSKLSSIYENKEIYEKNQDFINGKYNPCKSCEFYESL